MWVRGLKHCYHPKKIRNAKSHPMWVRGLKPIECCENSPDKSSHPMWVRGLKHKALSIITTKIGRTLCGCVD